MAEPKRIQLEPTKTLQRDKNKKSKALPPTYRFDLHISEIKTNNCAEYSYAELVNKARAAENDTKQPGSDDPFSLDDDDDKKLQELARKYEEKYNPKPGRKKKKKHSVSEDYIDKGMGYDETDPFIDNDEAYDELVPSTLTTQFGGFYINKGDLEFRNLAEEALFDSRVRKKKFRGLDKDGRKKRKLGSEENQKRRGRKPLIESSSALIKPVKKTQPTVADMLQQHKAKLQQMQQDGMQPMQLNPISVEREREIEQKSEDDIADNVEALSGQKSTITDAIESVVKAAASEKSNESVGPCTGSSDDNLEIKPEVDNIEAPKLPENLPSELDDIVTKLKQVAFKSEEGKCKFFSEEVNRMLLRIELKAQELTSAQRSTIYAHLASHLPCTKETLQKRAKKLRLNQEYGKLKEPMQKLKDGIAVVMPEMMEKYLIRLKESDTKESDIKTEVSAAGSDGEESAEENEKKQSNIPKKHFEWNDTVRKYLCDVVRIKLKCYEVSKTRIQSAEEYLKHFLETEVKNLWPPGWMRSRILFKESKAAHVYITNRPKKQIIFPKKALYAHNSKPAVSILNTVISQESEFEQIFQDKSVPFIPPLENVLDKRENLDLLPSNPGVSTEDRVAEYAKLFTLPIQTSVADDLSISKVTDSINVQGNTNKVSGSVQGNSNKVAADPNTSPLSAKIDSAFPKSSVKTEKQAKPLTSKSSPFPPKVSDYSAFAEGSLASDMLARIICASLADYPYSGSHNIESSSKNTSVISPNPGLIKESNVLNTKFSNDLQTSPKNLDSTKLSVDRRKSSQDLTHVSDIGLNIESLLNIKNQSVQRHSETGQTIKNKGLPDTLAVNLKQKNFVPHSRQFAEAFERTPDVPPSKKHSMKGHNVHIQGSSINSSSSSRALNAIDLHSDYPSSTSPRGSLENAQKLALELANKYSSTPQGSVSAPYKKRTKYPSSSNKINDPWTQMFDASVGSALLEGMKGFPFPVSLPTPPPAHSSTPHRTTALIQHSSPRTTSHISPGLRSIHESKSDNPNHNTQSQPNIITVSDVQRRQSLIQGPWKTNQTSQSPSTSHSHFMTGAASPPISIQSKTTSPNHHVSNSRVSLSPVPAHSMLQVDKPYNRSHSPLPPRASPSHLSSIGHTSKTPPISYSNLGQVPYSTHQSSLSVSQAIHHVIARSNNIHDPLNSATLSAAANVNQELKNTIPRTN